MSGILLYIIICLVWCIWQIVNHFKDFFTRDSLISLKLNTYIISSYDTMLWYRLEDLNSAECGLFFMVPFILVIYSIVLLQELDIYHFKE